MTHLTFLKAFQRQYFFVGVLFHFHVSTTSLALWKSWRQGPGKGRVGYFFYCILFYFEIGNRLNINISLRKGFARSLIRRELYQTIITEHNKVWKQGLCLPACHRHSRRYSVIWSRHNSLGLLTSNLFCTHLSGSSDKFPRKQPKVIAIHSHKSLLAAQQSL